MHSCLRWPDTLVTVEQSGGNQLTCNTSNKGRGYNCTARNSVRGPARRSWGKSTPSSGPSLLMDSSFLTSASASRTSGHAAITAASLIAWRGGRGGSEAEHQRPNEWVRSLTLANRCAAPNGTAAADEIAPSNCEQNTPKTAWQHRPSLSLSTADTHEKKYHNIIP